MTIWAFAVLLVGCGESEPTQTTIVARLLDTIEGPESCARPMEDFIAAIDRDLAAGRLNQSSHSQIRADLRTLRSTCETGNDVDALRQLGTVKHRYGY
jgi:hypothetical protein